MVICTTCGAENKPLAAYCRMCKASLESSGSSEATTVPAIDLDSPIDTTVVMTTGETAVPTFNCPQCQEQNEIGWVFCQQCGGRLSQTGPNLGASEELTSSAANWRTVVDQPRISQPGDISSPDYATKTDKTGSKELGRPGSKPGGEIPCPKCSILNPVGNRFCASCGAMVALVKTAVMSSLPPKSTIQLKLITEGGRVGMSYDLGEKLSIGRLNGDLSFPHDDFLSITHASVIRRGDSYFLVDEASSNGTYVRIKGEVELKPGDTFMAGRQIFRLGE